MYFKLRAALSVCTEPLESDIGMRSFKFRTITALSALAFAAAMTTACSPDEPAAPGAAAPRKVTVQYGWLLDGGSAASCTALVKGYYKDAGLDVTLKPGGPVGATFLNATNAVATNSDVDIAVDNDLVTLIEGAARNNDKYSVRAFASLWQQSPLGFIVRADSGITSLKDLAKEKPGGGKYVIGSTPGAPIFKALADYAGVKVDDLKITTIGGDATPLIAGKIDALLGFSTNQAVAVEKAGIAYRFLPVSELPGFTQPVYVAMARKDFIAKNPELLDKWLKATADGARETIRDPKAAAGYLRDDRCGGPQLNADQQLTLVQKSLDYMKVNGSDAQIGQLNLDVIKGFIPAYSAAAGLPRTPGVDELIDTSVVKRVYGK